MRFGLIFFLVYSTITSHAQPLQDDAIQGIVIKLRYTYGVGGAVMPIYVPYLALKDGHLYKNIIESPYTIDPKQSVKDHPELWGKWKADGKTLEVQFMKDGKWVTERWEKNWYWAKPALNNEKIEGAFKTISGGGNTALGGTTMIVSGAQIAFNKRGEFTMEKYSGGSSYDFGVGTATSARSSQVGRYQLNGFSITLKKNSGETLTKCFYFYPDSRSTFGIGASVYSPVKK